MTLRYSRAIMFCTFLCTYLWHTSPQLLAEINVRWPGMAYESCLSLFHYRNSHENTIEHLYKNRSIDKTVLRTLTNCSLLMSKRVRCRRSPGVITVGMHDRSFKSQWINVFYVIACIDLPPFTIFRDSHWLVGLILDSVGSWSFF